MDTLWRLERLVVHWIAKDLQQRTLRRAALAAHRHFARCYPQWSDALFDEHFVRTWVVPLLLDAAAERARVPATVLASAWANQLSGTTEDYRRRQAKAMPIAAAYLRLVAEQLEIEYDAPTWRGLPDLYPAG